MPHSLTDQLDPSSTIVPSIFVAGQGTDALSRAGLEFRQVNAILCHGHRRH